MKRLVIILSIIISSVAVFANADFDETCNYQFENAKAYEGEILYLLPITRSSYETGDLSSELYHWFKDYSFNDNETSEYNSYYNYKSDYSDYRDSKLLGTHKRHIEAHRFYVMKVMPYHPKRYKYTWVFHLVDLNTGDKLKFIYHAYGDSEVRFDMFMDFPFIVEKHLEYCVSLRGSKLVFATNKCRCLFTERNKYYCPTFINDMITGEKINYTDVYAKWTIKDVSIDWYNLCICFIVTNGKNTTKVPYGIQYYANHPLYNSSTRVFTESQWNALVNKYGLDHMKLIMDTKISDDMTNEEKIMSMGYRAYNPRKEQIQEAYEILTELGKHGLKVIQDCAEALNNELFDQSLLI